MAKQCQFALQLSSSLFLSILEAIYDLRNRRKRSSIQAVDVLGKSFPNASPITGPVIRMHTNTETILDEHAHLNRR